MATMLEEHAVSEVKLGPLKSKKCEMRLDCMAYAQPRGFSFSFHYQLISGDIEFDSPVA